MQLYHHNHFYILLHTKKINDTQFQWKWTTQLLILFPSDFHFSSHSRAYSLSLSIKQAQRDLLK